MTPSKTQRIIFPDGVDLSEVASSDEARYALSFIHVKKGIARATDGRCLVLAEVTNETESPEALIPKKAIKIAAKKKSKSAKALGSKNLTLARTDRGATFPTIIFSEEHPDRIALLMPLSGSATQNPLWVKIKKGALNDD